MGFHDRIPWRERNFRDMLRIWTTGGFADPHAAREAVAVPRVEGLPRAMPRVKGQKIAANRASSAPWQDPAPPPASDLSPPATGVAVTWIGHATTLVQLGGKSFLTDPVWSDRLPGLIPRLTPPGVAWEDLPPIDGIVVSHDHYDHLDAPTVKRVPRDTPVFAPLGVGEWFRRRGFTAVRSMDWWDEAELEGVTITCTPVQHWCQRGLWDRNRRLWAGWVLAPRDGPSAFFGGDTGFFEGFRKIGERLSPDIAILPVGAYEPRWFMEPMHMDPEEAVRAARELASLVMVPMHWGTFCLSREPMMEPIQRTRKAWAEAGFRREDLWDLALGERRVLEG